MKIKNSTILLYLSILLLGSIGCTLIPGMIGKLSYVSNPSSQKLLQAVLLSTLLVIFIGLIYLDQKTDWVTKTIKHFLSKENYIRTILLVLLVTLFEIVQDIIFLFTYQKPPHYDAYLALLEKLFPIMLIALFFSIVTLIFLLVYLFRTKSIICEIDNNKKQWIFTFLAVVGFYWLMAISGYGFIPFTSRDPVFNIYGDLVPTNAPVIGLQAFAVILGLLILSFFVGKLFKMKPLPGDSWIWDLCIGLVLWVVTFATWMNTPFENNSFIHITDPPDHSIYPISDAFYFDKEALQLINTGEFSDTTTHVFYSFFLAVLHGLTGPNYLDIYWIQVAVLSFIPFLLYRLTSILSSEFPGVMVAALYIIRERNGLLLSDDLSGTLVNQFMTESFALLLFVCFFIVYIQWIRFPERYGAAPWLSGGIIGIMLLVRAEILAAVLAVVFGTVIHLWQKKRILVLGLIKISLMVLLITLPWMTRNYIRSGVFTLDKGAYVQNSIKTYLNNTLTSDATPENINGDSAVPEKTPRLKFIPNQIVSSFWQSILVLPTSYQPLFSLASFFPDVQEGKLAFNWIFSEKYAERYVKSSPYFWYSWDGRIEPRSILPIAFVLFLVSVGLWKVWSKERTVALILPLALFGHIFIWAFARYSGGRFIKPSDWIPMVFYCIGISELIYLLFRQYNFSVIDMPHRTTIFPPREGGSKEKGIKTIRIGLVLISLLLGMAPTLSEYILPDKYPDDINRSDLMNSFQSLTMESSLSEFRADLDSPAYESLYGKALYPVFFNAGDGYEDDRKGTMPDRDNSRVDFYLIGDRSIWVSLPIGLPEHIFAHYSDVVVFGEYSGTSESFDDTSPLYFRASKVYYFSDGGLSSLEVRQ